MTVGLKDVKIILHQADGTSMFQPSLLSGILEMCPRNTLSISEVRMKLGGEAFVSLEGTERREVFLDITQTIFPSASEVQPNGEVGETTLQEKVRYTLPFTFQLMDHYPSSIDVNSTYSGITAYVQYFVESIIIKGKNIVEHKSRKEFKFLQTLDLSAMPTEYATPRLYNKSLRIGTLGLTSVHLSCELERTVYYVGETVTVMLTVDNSERKIKTKFIIAQLVQDINLIVKENDHSSLHKSATIKVLQSVVVVDGVQGKKCERMANVQLPIKPNDLPPTVETRKSVLMNYAIVVKVIVDEKSKLSLKIPIRVVKKGNSF